MGKDDEKVRLAPPAEDESREEPPTEVRASEGPLFPRVASALFYAVSSLAITMVNKTVLTTYAFPSYQTVALGQMLFAVVSLFTAKNIFRVITFPNINTKTFKDISPLPFIYFGNMVFGLGGTKEISLPMFTMLRRFSIVITMIGEYYILGVVPTVWVNVSVFLMVGGAVIAAISDLGFNMEGYTLVFVTNFLTAMYGVYTKKLLDLDMGKYGLIYYCALFMLPFSVLGILVTGELQPVMDFPGWSDPLFLVQFVGSCSMGFLLTYSTVLCTQYNSALTTSIIGCLKNILVSYLGMFVGGDYIFTVQNFLGINLSVFGSIIYTYVTFQPPKKKMRPPINV